jgi:hypothetical protein
VPSPEASGLIAEPLRDERSSQEQEARSKREEKMRAMAFDGFDRLTTGKLTMQTVN